MSKKTVFGVLALLVIGSYTAFAWGNGHDSQAEQIWKLLPESFKSHYSEKQRQDFVKLYSHYPDYCSQWKKDSDGGKPAAKTCYNKTQEMKFNPHRTYIVFPLFVQALREKRYEDALMWAGCIVHSMGDMGALNHPDIKWFPEACLGYSGVKYVRATSAATYDKTYFDKKFQPLYDKAMDGYKGKVISLDPQEVLRHIIARDHYRKLEMNVDPRVYNIFQMKEKYAENKSPETLAKVAEALAKYTRSATCEILDTLITGIAFSKMEKIPEFDFEKAKINAYKKEYFTPPKDPVAKDMIIFTDIWQEKPLVGSIGVIVSDRPSLVYKGGCPLGSKHQWLTSIILRSLKEDNTSYQCLSYERLPVLDSKVNPELIVVAPKYRNDKYSEKFDSALVKYINDGGRVIWLGGKTTPKLSKLLPKNKLPASPKGNNYLFPFPVLDKKKKIDAKFIKISDGNEFIVPDLLKNKYFSWNTFGECRCLFFEDFTNDENKKALLKFETPDIKRITAVKVKVGKGGLVYMPWYIICPYMLSNKRVMESFVNLKLDPIGMELLRIAMNKPLTKLQYKEGL